MRGCAVTMEGKKNFPAVVYGSESRKVAAFAPELEVRPEGSLREPQETRKLGSFPDNVMYSVDSQRNVMHKERDVSMSRLEVEMKMRLDAERGESFWERRAGFLAHRIHTSDEESRTSDEESSYNSRRSPTDSSSNAEL